MEEKVFDDQKKLQTLWNGSILCSTQRTVAPDLAAGPLPMEASSSTLTGPIICMTCLSGFAYIYNNMHDMPLGFHTHYNTTLCQHSHNQRRYLHNRLLPLRKPDIQRQTEAAYHTPLSKTHSAMRRPTHPYKHSRAHTDKPRISTT